MSTTKLPLFSKFQIGSLLLGGALILMVSLYESFALNRCLSMVRENLCSIEEYRTMAAFPWIINNLPEVEQYSAIVSFSSFIGWVNFILILLGAGIISFTLFKVGLQYTKEVLPKPSSVPNRATINSSTKSLIDMKRLLDEKVITQTEFDEYKKKHLGNLKEG